MADADTAMSTTMAEMKLIGMAEMSMPTRMSRRMRKQRMLRAQKGKSAKKAKKKTPYWKTVKHSFMHPDRLFAHSEKPHPMVSKHEGRRALLEAGLIKTPSAAAPTSYLASTKEFKSTLAASDSDGARRGLGHYTEPSPSPEPYYDYSEPSPSPDAWEMPEPTYAMPDEYDDHLDYLESEGIDYTIMRLEDQSQDASITGGLAATMSMLVVPNEEEEVVEEDSDDPYWVAPPPPPVVPAYFVEAPLEFARKLSNTEAHEFRRRRLSSLGIEAHEDSSEVHFHECLIYHCFDGDDGCEEPSANDFCLRWSDDEDGGCADPLCHYLYDKEGKHKEEVFAVGAAGAAPPVQVQPTGDVLTDAII
jgi:hypothetical protein